MVPHRKLITLAVLFTAASLTFAGCSSAPQSGTTDTGSSTPTVEGVSIGAFGGEQLAIGDPVSGGDFVWAAINPIVTLDSAGIMGDSILLAMKGVYGTLMSMTNEGGVEPNLALSLETKDNITWVLELDPEVKLTDGTPLNAAAVIEHVANVAAEGSTSTQASEARQIVSTKAVDEFTVEFELAAPNNQFGLQLAENSLAMIPSPAARAEFGADYGLNPVGAGPFSVSKFDNNELVLVKNPDYKFADEGLPYLDSFTFMLVPEESSRIDGILAGDLDGATVASVPSVHEARDKGLVGLEEPVQSAFYLILNNQAEGIDDIRIRTALNEAVDRDAINEVVYEGLHKPMDGIFVPDHPYADLDAEWPSYDPDHATELVEEYKADKGLDNVSLVITIVPGGDNAEIAPLVQQMLKKVGIDASIQTQEQTSVVGKYVEGDFDIALITRSFQAETSTALKQGFQSESVRNWSHVNIPEVDALLEESSSALSDEERMKNVPEILEILAENVVTVPIVTGGAGRVLGPDVAGFPDGDPTARTIQMFDLSKVWMKAE